MQLCTLHNLPRPLFLSSGERLEAGIRNVIILQADEAVVLTAQDEFDDILPSGKKVHRPPGDRWMIHGPTEYIPRIEIGNMQHRWVGVCVYMHVHVRNVCTCLCACVCVCVCVCACTCA